MTSHCVITRNMYHQNLLPLYLYEPYSQYGAYPYFYFINASLFHHHYHHEHNDYNVSFTTSYNMYY